MQLTSSEKANLLALLLSPNDDNTALALEMLPARDYPRALLTEVFVIFKLTKNEELRQSANDFLQHHPFGGLMHVMNSNLQLGQNAYLHPTEQTIKKNIDTYVALSQGTLDGLRLAKAMYRKYKLGLKYLLERLPVAERKELLGTFIKGTAFKLTHSSLTTFPKELYEFTSLTSIDLSHNKLKTIPSKIKDFQHLEILLVSNNNLVSVTPTLRDIPTLRHLDISHNKFKQFPESVTALSQLRTLRMAQLNHLLLGETIPVPPSIQRLTQLREMTLSDHPTGYSQGLALGYSNFPNFSTLTAPEGAVLDMNPLKLAEQAYRQNGGSEGVLFLFAYSGDQDLIQRIIQEQFYEESMQRFDLKSTMLLALPSVLQQFPIRSLQLRGSYLGTQHYAYGTKNAHREWALHHQKGIDQVFSALEGQQTIFEADLSRNRLRHLPKAMCSWKGLRHLDLSQNVLRYLPDYWGAYPNLEVLDLRNNELQDLETNLEQLQNLRVLYLNNNQLKELPAILGHLHNLEELHLVNALYPASERDSMLAIPESWSQLLQLKKLHLYDPRIYKARALYHPILRRLLPQDCVIHLAYA